MKIHLIKIDENSYIQKTNYSFKTVRINELNYKLLQDPISYYLLL
jgi:hypothetical protein